MTDRLIKCAVAALGVLLFSCTSSSTPTQIQSNATYDSQFRDQTRSSQNYQTGGQLEEGAQGDPPLTIMMLSMETGNVHPGEDYYVYAVVDNPVNREIEYVWSVANGDVAEVPEAERGRLTTIVETEYAGGTAGAAGAPSGAAPPDGEAPPAGAAPPSGFTRPGGAAAPGTGGGGAPVGPGGAPSGPAVRPGGGGTGSGADIDAPGMGGGEGRVPEKEPMSDEEGSENPETPPADQEQEAADRAGGDGSGEEEPEQQSLLIWERRQVAGPPAAQDSQGEENEGGAGLDPDELAAQIQGDADDPDFPVDETAAEEDAQSIDDTEVEAVGPAAVAERISEGAAGAGNTADDSILAGEPEDYRPLRSRFGTWREADGDMRRQPLGEYGEEEEETERLESEESFETYTFTTDEPYIVWTPERPGDTTIYLKIAYKGEDLTDPTALDVTIRLKDPGVVISDDFPEVVREDEDVIVRLDGENIPAFSKGLFTLSYDFNKLSFREAELGEFFDDAPDASLYYAQPNKTEGKVLLAIDTNTELVNLSGGGELVYVRFEAKQDIEDLEDSGLTLVSDASARYILDREGENILPEPIDYPVYRTELVSPPELATFTRENEPGVPGAAGAPAAGTGAAGAAGARPAGQPAGATGGTGGSIPTPSNPQTGGTGGGIPIGPGLGGTPPAGGVSGGVSGGLEQDRVVNSSGGQPAGTARGATNEQENYNLMTAIRDGSIEGVQKALRGGADPNWLDPATGMSALHMAVLDENRLMVRTLMSRLADPNLPSAEGKSAIQYAQEADLTEILAELQGAAPGATR